MLCALGAPCRLWPRGVSGELIGALSTDGPQWAQMPPPAPGPFCVTAHSSLGSPGRRKPQGAGLLPLPVCCPQFRLMHWKQLVFDDLPPHPRQRSGGGAGGLHQQHQQCLGVLVHRDQERGHRGRWEAYLRAGKCQTEPSGVFVRNGSWDRRPVPLLWRVKKTPWTRALSLARHPGPARFPGSQQPLWPAVCHVPAITGHWNLCLGCTPRAPACAGLCFVCSQFSANVWSTKIKGTRCFSFGTGQKAAEERIKCVGAEGLRPMGCPLLLSNSPSQPRVGVT